MIWLLLLFGGVALVALLLAEGPHDPCRVCGSSRGIRVSLDLCAKHDPAHPHYRSTDPPSASRFDSDTASAPPSVFVVIVPPLAFVGLAFLIGWLA